MLERGYNGVRAYGQSKLAQIMSGFELAARLPADEVTVNSLHPSTYMPTKMVLKEIGRHVDTIDDRVEATYRLLADPALATAPADSSTEPEAGDEQAYDQAARAALATQPRTRRSQRPFDAGDAIPPRGTLCAPGTRPRSRAPPRSAATGCTWRRDRSATARRS